MNSISYRLTPLQPFRLDFTVWALRREPANIMDRWDGQTYRRVLAANGEPIEFTVTRAEEAGESGIEVTAAGETRNLKEISTAALERLLGINIDLADFYRFAYNNKILEPLVRRFLGFRPPRFLTAFEAAVNGIACQQISLTAGISLLNRLCQAVREIF